MMQKTDNSPSFSRNWNDFKAGFGVVTGNFWLGNDQIHQLTDHWSDRSLTLTLTLTITLTGPNCYALAINGPVGLTCSRFTS